MLINQAVQKSVLFATTGILKINDLHFNHLLVIVAMMH